MTNHFLARANRTANITNSHRRAKKQEKEVAGRLGARLTSASGAKDEKGDARIKGVVRIEAKTTKNKSYSLTLETVGKIEEAAVASGEMPVIVIEFNDGFGKKVGELAVMPMYALETILANQA